MDAKIAGGDRIWILVAGRWTESTVTLAFFAEGITHVICSGHASLIYNERGMYLKTARRVVACASSQAGLTYSICFYGESGHDYGRIMATRYLNPPFKAHHNQIRNGPVVGIPGWSKAEIAHAESIISRRVRMYCRDGFVDGQIVTFFRKDVDPPIVFKRQDANNEHIVSHDAFSDIFEVISISGGPFGGKGDSGSPVILLGETGNIEDPVFLVGSLIGVQKVEALGGDFYVGYVGYARRHVFS